MAWVFFFSFGYNQVFVNVLSHFFFFKYPYYLVFHHIIKNVEHPVIF